MSPVTVESKTHTSAASTVTVGVIKGAQPSLDLDLKQIISWFNASDTFSETSDQLELDIVVRSDLHLSLLAGLPFYYRLPMYFNVPEEQIRTALSAQVNLSQNATKPTPPHYEANDRRRSSTPCVEVQCLFTTFDNESCVMPNSTLAAWMLDAAAEDTLHRLDLSSTVLMNMSGPVQFDHPSSGDASDGNRNHVVSLRMLLVQELEGMRQLSSSSRGKSSMHGQRYNEGLYEARSGEESTSSRGGFELTIGPSICSSECNDDDDDDDKSAGNTVSGYGAQLRVRIWRKDSLALLQGLRDGFGRCVCMYVCTYICMYVTNFCWALLHVYTKHKYIIRIHIHAYICFKT